MVGARLKIRRQVSQWSLVIFAPLPSILALFLEATCKPERAGHFGKLCSVFEVHTLLLVNLFFFINVCVIFWIISLWQRNTWLIDPYWTIAPVLIGHFYRLHSDRTSLDNARQSVCLGLLWIWSLRLTHSYLRREKWEIGAREDWRYADMRARYGKHWWWISFFAVYVVQHAMLVGISLPLYSVHASKQPWNALWDSVACAGCLLGIGVAAAADTQLHNFVTANDRRRAAGKLPVLLLNTGLWRYSRHPNYFGEQLWWWSLGVFAVNVGQPWALAGALFNSLCMVGVTNLTEARMLARPERVALFKEYQRRTSVWVPWFKSQKQE